MNRLSSGPNRFTIRLPALLSILVLLAGCWCELAGQAAALHPFTGSKVQAHFAAAQQAQERNDYTTAEREYQAVLAVAPAFAEVRMNLGLIYQLQNRVPEAMTEFRRALKIKPTLAGANFFLGVDYCKMAEGAKATLYLRAAAHAEPDRPDIWAWLATAQEMSGEIHAEVTTIQHALKLQPQDVDLLYLLGHAYERLGKKEVIDLEKVAPGSSWAEQLLAESYAASSQWPFAVIHFQNALAASPARTGVHVELGEVFLRAGRLKQATREFDDELRLDPHNLRAIVRSGEAKLIRGDVEGSLRDWAQAISVDERQAEQVLGMREKGFGDAGLEQLPDTWRKKIETLAPDLRTRNSPAANFALAFLVAQSGDSSKASSVAAQSGAANPVHFSSKHCSEDDVRQALSRGQFSKVASCVLPLFTSRSSTEFRIQVARALLEAGDYETSLKALGSLPSSDRHSPEALYWRTRCYEKLATATYLSLHQADPNSYRVHQLMADLEAAKENDGKAIDEYRAAIALKPSLPNLRYSLGHLLWKDLKIPEARVEFEAELALNPHHAGALHDLGNTYLLEHQPEKAMPYLKLALLGDAGDLDLHRDLGTGYFQLGDYRKAEAEFKIALSGDHDGSVHYKLARVYQLLGLKDKAAHEFIISTTLNRESHAKHEKQTQRLNEVERLSEDPQEAGK